MIYSFIPADVTVSNTATETAIFTQAVPASLFSVGRTLRFDCWGTYSATTIAPTITMRLRWGASIASSTVIASAVASALANSASNLGFNASTLSTVRATGSGGSIYTQGKLEYETALNAQLAAWVKSQAAVTVDLSADSNLIATLQFSGANVANVVKNTNGVLSIE